MTQPLDRFKFRYFDNTTGFMGEVISLNIEDDYLLVRFSYADEYTPDEEVFDFSKRGVLMQCTGLKDKNGKLIYEGDVIKINDYLYEVEFRNGAFKVKDGIYPTITQQYGFKDNAEIIGNIYENKDLIHE
jgi:uncharacterized phage protein (TIGR01671 family)